MQWQSSMKLLFMQLVHFGSFQITWSLDSQIVRSHRSLYFTWHQIRTSRIRRVRLKEQASLRFEDVDTETPKKTLRPFVRFVFLSTLSTPCTEKLLQRPPGTEGFEARLVAPEFPEFRKSWQVQLISKSICKKLVVRFAIKKWWS